jgi:hypothetical protein
MKEGVARIIAERHYKLVHPDQLTQVYLDRYRQESLKSSTPKV